ncbi:hypothetical protein BaRGS_00025596, partial [Batillaria attramentaria]
AVQGFRPRGVLFSLDCPPDASARLDTSLSKLQNIAVLHAVPENCGAAMQALQDARSLIRACLNSEDPDILKILGRHDLTSYIGKMRPLCLAQLPLERDGINILKYNFIFVVMLQ